MKVTVGPPAPPSPQWEAFTWSLTVFLAGVGVFVLSWLAVEFWRYLWKPPAKEPGVFS